MLVRLQTTWWALRGRLRDDTGATMPEYGLMVALIAAVVIAGAEILGLNVLNKFTEVAADVANAGP